MKKEKLNYVLIYNFFILRSKMVVFSIKVFPTIIFMGKNKKKQQQKNSMLKNIKF